jgi:hypothetical protein
VTSSTALRTVDTVSSCNGPSQGSLESQVGGSHYKDMAIQPVEYIEKNRLSYLEGCVVKYVSRHRQKGKDQDLRKAIHCLELLLELEYPS